MYLLVVMTKQQLDVIWNDNGLKDRIGRFYVWLTERGLGRFVAVEKFQRHVYDILNAYFVKGIKETRDGIR